jgi:hypothetical protein
MKAGTSKAGREGMHSRVQVCAHALCYPHFREVAALELAATCCSGSSQASLG